MSKQRHLLVQEIHHESAGDVKAGQFIVQHDAPTTISKLEQTWQEVKDWYAGIHHENMNDLKGARSLWLHT